ncbi:MAG: ATP-binding protein [Cyanobacteriota bacterium]|nr:ATP-binding protein [Cyanobacteriota bacterium]
MSHSTLALQNFARSVPTCEPTASFETLCALFETSQQDQIVVLGEAQTPLGAIALTTFMTHALGQMRQPTGPTLVRSGTEKSEAHTACVHSTLDARTLVAPLATLPASMSANDFLSYLQTGQLEAKDYQRCALVDQRGRFQGLLDSWHLFSTLLPLRGDIDSPSPPLAPLAPNWTALLQLLDKLPIPLMLQTGLGQVRYQNRTWREQLEETPDSNRWLPDETSQGSGAVSAWCNLTPDAEVPVAEVEPSRFSESHLEPRQSLANSPSSKPSAWQFVKLPLDLSMDWNAQSPTSLDSIGGGADIFGIAHLQSPWWLVLATDITEQRQLCKELAAKNADLVQLNRLKDEFLACISHELKTPLTAVLGLSSLLKDQKLGELTARQERYAQLIYQSGRQLMTVVNDLLDLTRIEAGQLKLNVEPTQIKSVCDRAYGQAQSHIAPRQPEEAAEAVGFTLDIEPGLDLIVADELRLRQMLVHLLDNALKFTPAGGEVGLSVSRWEGWIEFTVWDTGIGIPAESQHLIFQKFQQLESPLTRQFEGTGLGLVLTQRLARAHGGDISFISKEGEGSQFTLLLPPSPPGMESTGQPGSKSPKKRSASSSALHQQPSNPLILIVEAALQTIEQLNDQLQKLGYRVAIARSGTEALEKARGLQPRAILLNPEIPLLSGWDVLTLLKTDETTRGIPVAIAATRAERDIALQNGADGFLSLPVEKSDLQEVLYGLGEKTQMRDRGLTILRLNPEGIHLDDEAASFLAEFDRALLARSQQLNYRILATDDLEQADSLARVWQPDVLLLDGLGLGEPGAYLRSLQNYDRIAALPLVTLDPKITEAANQVKGLLVFPCLVSTDRQGMSALLQVIQIATGLSHQPRILIVGSSIGEGCTVHNSSLSKSREQLPPKPTLCSCETPEVSGGSEKSIFPHERHGTAGEAEFLQALSQYLNRGGLKSFLTCSWTEVYSQIQHRGVDLLFLHLSGDDSALEAQAARESLLKQLRQLSQLPVKPPVLVLDRRDSTDERTSDELDLLLEEVGTRVLRGHYHSCLELLEQIHSFLPG